MADNGAIVISELRKSFKELVVLDGVSLVAERGKILSLLGPNGAGKTTMVRILSTLIDFDSGKATVNGYDVRREASEVRASIGLTGQYAAVDEYLTGFENLEMIGRLYHLSLNESRRRAKELIRRFDLEEDQNRTVKGYSGGMRRKIDLAMSLIASPSILFLDEPTTGLDPPSRLTMWEIIKELKNLDVTILLTTQYMEEADYLSDRVVVLDEGKIIAEGTSAELKSKVGSERLELTIIDPQELATARTLINTENAYADNEQKILSIATEGGVNQLKDILIRLDAANIKVESLSLRHPTLDDVFLSLTGHKTEEEKLGI